MVYVETIAFLCHSSAKRTDGTRYPSDLPTPVPASSTTCCSSSSARAIRAAISCCCGRNSKFFALESGPFSEKNPNAFDEFAAEIVFYRDHLLNCLQFW